MSKIKNSIKSVLADPVKIYGWLIILFLLFCFAIIPIADIGHSGGEQIPLILFGESINYAVVIFFLVSIITTFTHRKWFKNNWYINLLIFLISGYLIIAGYFGNGSFDLIFN